MNYFYYWLGLGVLILNKLRHAIQSYKSPRPFSVNETARAVEYDLSIASKMEKALERYLGTPSPFKGKAVLELGPGDDLGVGLALLDRGAKQYIGFDVHHLAQHVPMELYDALIAKLDDQGMLRKQLENMLQEKPGRLHYRWSENFDLTTLSGENVDIVMGNASFEHFTDIEKTFSQLRSVVEPGALLVSEVDLQTHTGILRDRDPLNIYRFHERIYRTLQFQGSPNRVRPATYKSTLEKNGWSEIKIYPGRKTSEAYLKKVRPHLTRIFRKEHDMDWLDFIICAKFEG